MEQLSKQEKFEAAAKIRNQLYNLEHINDMVLLRRESPPRTSFKRIEGYDISHISGTSATGSMVVFENGKPNKAEYRKFRIKTIQGAHDTGMMQEVLARRLKHTEWKYPNLILIDGGTPQINAAFLVLKQHGLPIPVVGLAKGPHRKKVDLYFGNLNNRTKQHIKTIKESLIKVRNEAHRFALSYHRYLRLKRHRIRG